MNHMIVRTWPTGHGDTVEVYEVDHGVQMEYRWRVRAGNGEIVGQGEAHPRLANAVSAAERHHPPVN